MIHLELSENGGKILKNILMPVLSLSVILLGLSACGSSNESKQINNSSESNNQTVTKEVQQEEAKAQITDQVYYDWIDESTGTSTITSYAVIKNTGKVDADVTQTKVTYLDSEGAVIGTSSANGLFKNLTPSIIEPGEIAYLAIHEDKGEEFKDLKDVEFEVSPVVVDIKINKLEASKTKVIKTDDWGGDVHVTGFLQNKGDTDANDVEAAAGLYDENDKFLGALLVGSDDTTTVPAGSKSSIQVGVPSFPSDHIKDVDHAKIRAISF